MGTIVDVKMVVAVKLEKIEAEHESLKDGMRLKGDDAVQVSFVLRVQHRPVDLPVQVLQETILAQRAD
ncbi:unnamed protein product [Bemisia tabaci]|uniref:Uncharacterized protein n=1 Tax=Bemisia tabaci TaxID=7038 RepID=A0A9P0F5A4_BEMTA|nr:unnamed protein product [Bemisia tabaci]